MTIKEIKDYYKTVFYMEDDFIIDLAIAVTIGIYTSGEPIWLMIVGGSSSGKSEIIQMLGDVNFVYPISNMTENTFLSGMRSVDGKETSLLKRIGKKGVIVMKDYTSILAMRSEKRDIISSQMREIYDGHIVKETGNGLNPEWRGKINFIGGVTDSIYSSEGESAGMGRRSIMYCLPQQNRKNTLLKSVQNTNDADEKRTKIRLMVAEYIKECRNTMPSILPPINLKLSEELMELADFSTHARSPTERDYKGLLNLVHEAEMPMRVSQQLHLIAQILNFMYPEGLSENVKNGITKIAFDNIPKLRKTALMILAKHRRVTSKGMAHETDYPTEVARMWLEDLNVLKIVERSVGSNKMDMFRIHDEYREIILKYNSHIKYIEDDLIGDEESEGYNYKGDNYSIDSEILKANERQIQEEFEILSYEANKSKQNNLLDPEF
jgi:hypothetical protein